MMPRSKPRPNAFRQIRERFPSQNVTLWSQSAHFNEIRLPGPLPFRISFWHNQPNDSNHLRWVLKAFHFFTLPHGGLLRLQRQEFRRQVASFGKSCSTTCLRVSLHFESLPEQNQTALAIHKSLSIAAGTLASAKNMKSFWHEARRECPHLSVGLFR